MSIQEHETEEQLGALRTAISKQDPDTVRLRPLEVKALSHEAKLYRLEGTIVSMHSHLTTLGVYAEHQLLTLREQSVTGLDKQGQELDMQSKRIDKLEAKILTLVCLLKI